MSIIDSGYFKNPRKIALVNLVRPKTVGNKQKYQYIATRVYDPVSGKVRDEVIGSLANGVQLTRGTVEIGYATWSELPMLDTQTQQLVGKNKERYCTIISVRVYRVGEIGSASRRPDTNRVMRDGTYEYEMVRVLGYTFMDINGDKIYRTVQQVCESDILEHTHSVCKVAKHGVYMRNVDVARRVTTTVRPWTELDDTDTSEYDTIVTESQVYKALTVGWYTIGCDGGILIDRQAIENAHIEEIEIPNGILSIPDSDFAIPAAKMSVGVKRVKLPEGFQSIGVSAFYGYNALETINIPRSVLRIGVAAFSGCKRIKELDLRYTPLHTALFSHTRVERLTLSDRQDLVQIGSVDVGTLEFCNTNNARLRELKTAQGGKTKTPDCITADKIETNGPVVLGYYRCTVKCKDASALEPNIIGIAANSTFKKVLPSGAKAPWLLGARTEYVYSTENAYRFTEDAYKQGNIKAITWSSRHASTVLPDSVELLQGTVTRTMETATYPNVLYASYGIFADCIWTYMRRDKQNPELPYNMPALQWILSARKYVTLQQAQQVVKRLEPNLVETLEDMRKAFKSVGYNVLRSESRDKLKQRMLYKYTGNDENEVIESLIKKYSMVYIGDYNAILGRR